MNEQELLKLKKEIDNAKAEVQELTGERNYLLKELKETWQCKTIEAAEKLVEQMEASTIEMKKVLTELLEKIESKYNG